MPFPIAVFCLIIGYSLLFTGAANLRNGGKGPKLFAALGFTTDLTNPADNPDAFGSIAGNAASQGGAIIGGNQTGPVPGSNPSPGGVRQV